MFHSTVCTTIVSTKETRHTLGKYVSKLRITPHAREGNAPVTVKKYVFVQAIKCGHGYRCVYAWVIIHQISNRQLLVCMCNGSTPESAVRDAPQICVWVCAHIRSRVGMGVCVCLSSTLYRRQLLACAVCMYEVLCIKNSIVFPYYYTRQPSQ